ncbi:MAG: DegT/DnrJ/EryC1/StrS family aminotransferase [Pyrinomonadaceae bacterium]
MKASELAILGGAKAVVQTPPGLFDWPLMGEEDEAAVIELLRKPNFADWESVDSLEKEFGRWLGVRHALTYNSGTSAIEAAMFASGVGPGTEVIVPSLTHWASALPAFRLGATVAFADISALTLNIDPASVERLLTDDTRAIVVVHQHGRPCDMSALVALTRSHSVALIEDASQALGSIYKGQKVGTFGDVAAISLNGKAIAAGEGGILVTNDRALFERAVSWGHDHRFTADDTSDPQLRRYAGLPLGGTTSRMHNVSAALARVQLRHLEARMGIVGAAMCMFWDRLDGLPGIIPHRTPPGEGSTMGCWYRPLGLYEQRVLGGLSLELFAAALRAEGVQCELLSDFRRPLHLHPRLREGGNAALYGVPEARCRCDASLEATENVKAFTVPRFSKLDVAAIEAHAAAFTKVIRHHEELLDADRRHNVAINEAGESGNL